MHWALLAVEVVRFPGWLWCCAVLRSRHSFRTVTKDSAEIERGPCGFIFPVSQVSTGDVPSVNTSADCVLYKGIEWGFSTLQLLTF